MVLFVGLAGCMGGGPGGGDGTTTTAADTTTAAADATTTAATATNGTMGNVTNATQDDALLFDNQNDNLVNVSANGTVVGDDDQFLGNVSIVDDNQQGGDGFTDVNVFENGTVVDQQGDVVGEVQINEVCPTPSENGEFWLDGDSVDVSGAQGDVFFDNQDDSFVDFNIVEDNQGDQPGFQDVRIATNGSVINEQGDVVGQVEVDQRCPSPNASN